MNICEYLLVVTWFCLAMLCFIPVAAQAPCAFPFIFKGVRYTACTTVDDPDNKLWCSTKTDNQDRHIERMGHWKHCAAIIRSTLTCGSNNIPDRIVGGTDAQLTAWPWMVVFRARSKSIRSSCSDNNPSCSGWASNGECQKNPSFMNSNCKKSCNKCSSIIPGGPSNWICGGVLITDQYVLSAAHCFKDNFQVEFARIGEFDLSTNPDRGGGHIAPEPQDIDIERIIRHEMYNTQNCRRCNDIALVKLAKPARLYSFFVEPVCLPSNPQKEMGFSVSAFQGKNSWATGWGVTDIKQNTKLSNRLQQANLTIQELDFCRQRKKSLPNGSILCAGQGDGKDTCRADSGGPIMLSNQFATQWYVVGITSFGSAICGSRSDQSVYTSVHYYMDWIKQNIT